MHIPLFVPVAKRHDTEWTGTAFDCDYNTWVPDCPLKETALVSISTKTSAGAILSTNSDGCLAFIEDRVKNDRQTRHKYVIFHVPPVSPLHLAKKIGPTNFFSTVGTEL